MNQCTFTGRLTADPETRTTQSGHRVVPFSLAVDRKKKPDEERPRADFIRFEAWDAHADVIAKYARKGMKLLIQGELRADQYTDKNGNNREKVYVLVRSLELPPKPPQAKPAPDPTQQVRKSPVDVNVQYDDDFAYYDEQDLPF